MRCCNFLPSVVTTGPNARPFGSTIYKFVILFLVMVTRIHCQGNTGSSCLARVTNGERAPKGRFPYMCSIRRRGSGVHACGGVLIGDDWMVTAAHCLDPKYPDSVGLSPFVYCDIIAREDQDPSKRFSTQKCYLHPQWQNDIFIGSDIAVCKLDKSTGLPSPDLANIGEAFNAASVFDVLGWGKTSLTSGPADYLQIGKCLSYRSNSVCNNVPILGGQIKASMICAGGQNVDTCRGDSGGPLLIPHNPNNDAIEEDPGLDLIVGITSFGNPSCTTTPGVYTRISCFRSWINCIMEGNGDPCNIDNSCQMMSSPPVSPSPEPVVVFDPEDIKDAIESDDFDELKKYLDDGLDPNTVFADTMDSLLIFAAENNKRISANVLIDNGANVDYKDSNERTALARAAAAGSERVIQLLIDNEANIESRDQNGNTPLNLAALNNKPEALEILLRNFADTESKNNGGFTPLHHAAFNNYVAIAMELLDAKADTEARDNNRDTPLAIAAYYEHLRILRTLLGRNADVNSVNNDGQTPLHLAASRGHLSIVEELLNEGASKEDIDNNEQTPFDVICKDQNLVEPCREGIRTRLERALRP